MCPTPYGVYHQSLPTTVRLIPHIQERLHVPEKCVCVQINVNKICTVFITAVLSPCTVQFHVEVIFTNAISITYIRLKMALPNLGCY